MRQINKYEIRPESIEWGVPFEMDLPSDTLFRHFTTQRQIPCLWADVNMDNDPVTYEFVIFGTGAELMVPGTDIKHSQLQYIGTAHMSGQLGDLVLHLHHIQGDKRGKQEGGS